MNSTIVQKNDSFKTIAQIAVAIKKLSKNQLELLEVELDEEFADKVLERGKRGWAEYKAGNTLGLEELKKDLQLT